MKTYSMKISNLIIKLLIYLNILNFFKIIFGISNLGNEILASFFVNTNYNEF
jgi:hypothetical protein